MKKEFLKALCLVASLAFILLVVGCSDKVSYSQENLSLEDDTKNHELSDVTKEEDELEKGDLLPHLYLKFFS